MSHQKKLLPILILCFALLACGLPTQQVATNTPVPSQTPTVELQNGTIAGHVNYPSDFIPPLKVVAYRAGDFGTYYFVETVLNQSEYSLSVPPGDYYVVSYVSDGSMGGGYTQAVLCGNQYGCNDHSFVPVTVLPGATTTGIDPSDWYAPPGTFPPMP